LQITPKGQITKTYPIDILNDILGTVFAEVRVEAV
jgi:hypothetical protein